MLYSAYVGLKINVYACCNLWNYGTMYSWRKYARNSTFEIATFIQWRVNLKRWQAKFLPSSYSLERYNAHTVLDKSVLTTHERKKDFFFFFSLSPRVSYYVLLLFFSSFLHMCCCHGCAPFKESEIDWQTVSQSCQPVSQLDIVWTSNNLYYYYYNFFPFLYTSCLRTLTDWLPEL